ncbi:hypothetical protein [Sphingomonas trueperi]|uniref:Uncharacterized protein n=1 Tax=Sphingomonas trueperi TaxID=53317 RepID=A0A7X5Y3A7_9SPHN|nr:hypothetical protein [Sphingomonas trueperi]NJB99883.1 hypothetical protein [Sphingomonas trueperi]
MFNEEQRQRYEAACHAMQSGVAFEQSAGSKCGSPKHLRVGINSAMVETSALAHLLVAKGICTAFEYAEAITTAMEEEARRYEARIAAQTGATVRLG